MNRIYREPMREPQSARPPDSVEPPVDLEAQAEQSLGAVVDARILNHLLGNGVEKGPLTVEIEALIDERYSRLVRPLLLRIEQLERGLEAAGRRLGKLEATDAKCKQATLLLAGHYKNDR
jgi:hypothetical protein